MSDDGLPHKRDLDRVRLEHLYELARGRREVIANLALLGLRSLVLLNGGAVVALFTILAHFDQLSVDGPLLWCAFGTFCGGVVAGLAAVLLGFLASNHFWIAEQSSGDAIYFLRLGVDDVGRASQAAEGSRATKGQRYWLAAVAAAGLGVAAFAGGSALALSAVGLKLRAVPAPPPAACSPSHRKAPA